MRACDRSTRRVYAGVQSNNVRQIFNVLKSWKDFGNEPCLAVVYKSKTRYDFTIIIRKQIVF